MVVWLTSWWLPRTIDGVAEEMRAVVEVADPAATSGRWQLGVWPWRRRRLVCRYEGLQLRAAEILGVLTPPRSEWLAPNFRGGLYDSRTGFMIEQALRAAGFNPLASRDA